MKLPLLMLLAGCAAPFVEARPSAPHDGVSVTWCGAQKTSPGSVMRSLDPPTGRSDERVEPPKELRVCLRVANGASKPLRFDRARVELKCPRERREAISDADDQTVTLAAGQTRDIYVGFTYTGLETGEEVQVVLDHALTLGGKDLRLAPLVLRHK